MHLRQHVAFIDSAVYPVPNCLHSIGKSAIVSLQLYALLDPRRPSITDRNQHPAGKVRIGIFDRGYFSLRLAFDEEEETVAVPGLAQVEDLVFTLENRDRTFGDPDNLHAQLVLHCNLQAAQEEGPQFVDGSLVTLFVLLFRIQWQTRGYLQFRPSIANQFLQVSHRLSLARVRAGSQPLLLVIVVRVVVDSPEEFQNLQRFCWRVCASVAEITEGSLVTSDFHALVP
jgi:hypothetical protein